MVTVKNPRFLNAEDDDTLDDTETAADIAILDPMSEICVLRGGVVDHPKYKGRKIFSAGINLTHLYRGKIPYPLVHPPRHGHRQQDAARPRDGRGQSRRSLWRHAREAVGRQLDVFAIGGGCQYLLAMDYVVAGSDAYMTLPARKEGIIPGAANLRLTRFVGARIARQAILMGRRLDCDTPEGRMICDMVVPPGEVEQAIDQVFEDFTGSGVVSAAGNRRAFRVGEEPLDAFRRYMAVYCREQAYCHFSPALIANLEKHWNAAQSKICAISSFRGAALGREPGIQGPIEQCLICCSGFSGSRAPRVPRNDMSDVHRGGSINSARLPLMRLWMCTMKAMAKIGVARLTSGIDTNTAITMPARKM